MHSEQSQESYLGNRSADRQMAPDEAIALPSGDDRGSRFWVALGKSSISHQPCQSSVLMASHPLDIRLGEDYITVGSVPLVPRGKPVSDLTRFLGAPDRVVPLAYPLAVHIYDQLGIRFWAKGQVVGELQFVLETAARPTLPALAFAGLLEYRGYAITQPASGQLLTSNELLGFVQDTDALQYNMLVFCAQTATLRYTAIVAQATGNITSISVV